MSAVQAVSIRANPVRAFAVVIVAVTSGFIMYISYRLIDILAAPEWCARAINAEKLSATRTASSFETCKELLLAQIKALAMNSHIALGITALCLLVLIVIVVAGGKLSLSASRSGVNANIGKEKVEEAVDRVVEATAAEGQAAKEEL